MSMRASKSGLGYEVQKKMEDNYDREDQAGTPMHVVNWVNALIEGEHSLIEGHDWKTICTHLRDGVALCKLINKLAVISMKFEKDPFLNVINCLHSLGFVANSKGVKPPYTGEVKKMLDME
ncbi:hypothetical protein ScPMuIL_015470 [Solemya velum]